MKNINEDEVDTREKRKEVQVTKKEDGVVMDINNNNEKFMIDKQEISEIIEGVLDKKLNDWLKQNLKSALDEAIEEALKSEDA